tara:strand:+ start:711 stop:1730 length:1020 start_codon:yes stop_codon:yes gene_type:complete
MQGLLMINLGSPDSTSIPDVKKYLDEFLMDKRVIGKSYIFRWILVKLIILNTRPKKSAKAYKKIWWKEGSPLIVLSERLFNKVEKALDIPAALAMRYGSISINKGINKLVNKGINEILVLPLYPHYAMSSYETVVEKVKEEVNDNFPDVKIKIVPPFYQNDQYIDLLSSKIFNTIKKIQYDHILFSYHGIPVSHLKISDTTNNHCYKTKDCCNVKSAAHETCYKHQVLETTKLVVEKLNIGEDKYSNSFQSRLPNEPWLKPYTDSELVRLAKAGKKRLVIVTPAFVTDCLETLEEIAMEGKEEFIEAGGEQYSYVPCLNDDENWAKLISDWTKDYLKLN